MGGPIVELDKLTELDAEEVLRGDKARRLAEEARLAREEAERRARELAASYEGSNALLAKIDAKLSNTDREFGIYGPDKVEEERPSSKGGSRPNSREGSRPSSREESRPSSKKGRASTPKSTKKNSKKKR